MNVINESILACDNYQKDDGFLIALLETEQLIRWYQFITVTL